MTTDVPDMAAVEAAKRRMRAEALVRMARSRRAGADVGIAASLAGGDVIPATEVVAGFFPIGDEIDVRPLLLGLIDNGNTVLLPETTPKGQPLVFRQWRPGMRMLPGRFGTTYPDSQVMTPTVVLVPLLAFDVRCHRLGYGGGYYDRTLPLLPGVRTIGCGYAAQRVDVVPTLPHDVPLDGVATEAGVIWREV